MSHRNKSQIINSITSSIYSNGAEEITGDKLQTVLTGMVTDLADQNTVDGLTQSVSQLSTSVTSISNWIETSGSQGGGGSIDGYTYKGIANTTSYNPGTGSSSVFYIASAPGTYSNFVSGSQNLGLSVNDNEVAIFKRTGNNIWNKDTTGAASKTVVDQLTQSIENINTEITNINDWIATSGSSGGGTGSYYGYTYMGIASSSTNPTTTSGKIFYIASTPGTYTHFGNSVVGDNQVVIFKFNGANWQKDITGAITSASGGGGGTGSSVDTLTTAKIYNYHPGLSMTWKGSDGLMTESNKVFIETDNVTPLSNSAYRGNTTIKGISRYPLNQLNTTDLSHCFESCSNLKFAPYFETNGVTDMSHMFENCSKLTDLDHPYNTINTQYMSYMFANCSDLEHVYLGDVTNVWDMSHMFENCTSLKNFNAAGNTALLEDTSYMFANCTDLVIGPTMGVSGGTYNPVNMSHMFENCVSLKEFAETHSLYGVLPNNMSYMFSGCSNLYDIPKINCMYVTSSIGTFDECAGLKYMEGLPGMKSSFDLSSSEQLSKQAMSNIADTVADVNDVSGDPEWSGSLQDIRTYGTIRLSEPTLHMYSGGRIYIYTGPPHIVTGWVYSSYRTESVRTTSYTTSGDVYSDNPEDWPQVVQSESIVTISVPYSTSFTSSSTLYISGSGANTPISKLLDKGWMICSASGCMMRGTMHGLPG